jgi:transposase
MLTIGIDWATASHTVVLMSTPGQVLATLRIKDTLEGYLHLLETIRRYGAGLNPDEIVFAIERKDLRLVEFLLASGFTGYLVDPNRMHGYRSRYKSSGAKDDNFDAFVLADLLWHDREQLPRISPEVESVRRLKILLADRTSFVQDSTALINRLRACLREYYPAALELFSDVAGSTALAFIKAYPSLELTRNLDRDTLKSFLSRHHSYQQERLVHILKVLTAPSIPVPAVIVATKQKTALRLVEQLRAVQQAIEEYDAEIRQMMEDNPEVKRFGTLPAAGPVVSGTLYTLFGEDRSRYQCAADVQSYVGTAPRTFQSGNYRRPMFRFACSQRYRAEITRWAFATLRVSDWAMEYYRSKRAEGKSHQHALRCLANILLKIAFAMWQKQTDYSEDHYLAQMTRHQMSNKAAIDRARSKQSQASALGLT